MPGIANHITRRRASTLWEYFLPKRAIVMSVSGAAQTRAEPEAQAQLRVAFVAAQPLAGAAGELFERMIEAIGLSRENIQVIETGPTEDRPSLEHRVLTTGASWAVCLGDAPAKLLQGSPLTHAGFQVLVTRHPEELIAQPSLKRGAWEDLKKLAQALGLPPPANRRS